MKLWPVEHFWLTFCADLEKKWAKSVQLVRVSFFPSDFLQNPYFRRIKLFKSWNIIWHQNYCLAFTWKLWYFTFILLSWYCFWLYIFNRWQKIQVTTCNGVIHVCKKPVGLQMVFENVDICIDSFVSFCTFAYFYGSNAWLRTRGSTWSSNFQKTQVLTKGPSMAQKVENEQSKTSKTIVRMSWC